MWGDELIRFGLAEYLGDNRYRVSMLQRGRKGTEHATGGHAAGERFVVLEDGAVQRIALDVDDIDAARVFKAVSLGGALSAAAEHDFTPGGVSLKPWPPSKPRAYRSGSDWNIKCYERTRIGGELRNYVGITRDPGWAGWDLEILDGPDGSVVRTESGLTDPEYTYTAAEQIADFGSAQTALHFRWYQLSSVVGRGYPSEGNA